MKIAPLLAQFLYANQRLDIPGIGTFLLSAPHIADTESGRPAKPAILDGVSFENNTAVRATDELIAFVSAQTGKIKALAAADLDSHFELAKQFLNIGKPFLFEGIGSLTKMQGGGFAFVPGYTVLIEKSKESTLRETGTSPSAEEPVGEYRDIFYTKKAKPNFKKPLVILLLLIGIFLAVWGGYKVYKRTTAKHKPDNNTETPVTKEPVQAPPDSNRTTLVDTGNLATTTSTNPVAATSQPAPSGSYKFVVETADKKRALYRYDKLQKIGLKSVMMETNDSLSFRIYFMIPANPADTAHILDSLRRAYTPPGKTAYVAN